MATTGLLTICDIWRTAHLAALINRRWNKMLRADGTGQYRDGVTAAMESANAAFYAELDEYALDLEAEDIKLAIPKRITFAQIERIAGGYM